MPRVFTGLAIGQFIVLVAAAAMGVAADAEAGSNRHVVLAVFALLLACLIQVVVLTYLSVTGKMMAQAVHLGRLDGDSLPVNKAFKRTVTHLIGALLLAIVVAIATGAVAWRSEQSGGWHGSAGALVLLLQLYVYYREWFVIRGNATLVGAVMTCYAQTRGGERDAGAESGLL